MCSYRPCQINNKNKKKPTLLGGYLGSRTAQKHKCSVDNYFTSWTCIGLSVWKFGSNSKIGRGQGFVGASSVLRVMYIIE